MNLRPSSLVVLNMLYVSDSGLSFGEIKFLIEKLSDTQLTYSLKELQKTELIQRNYERKYKVNMNKINELWKSLDYFLVELAISRTSFSIGKDILGRSIRRN
jgi:DNA-binding transcriptional regulator GbsR (MarR family)